MKHHEISLKPQKILFNKFWPHLIPSKSNYINLIKTQWNSHSFLPGHGHVQASFESNQAAVGRPRSGHKCWIKRAPRKDERV